MQRSVLTCVCMWNGFVRTKCAKANERGYKRDIEGGRADGIFDEALAFIRVACRGMVPGAALGVYGLGCTSSLAHMKQANRK